jgi:carbon storage regulator CsrA
MLVLSRKNRESVIIGCPATGNQMMKVTVLDVRGRKVRLGIEGDRSIRVLRSELLERDLAAEGACFADCCRGAQEI